MDAVITPVSAFVFSIDYPDNYSATSVAASQSTPLTSAYQVAEYPQATANLTKDYITVSLSVEAGSLSAVNFNGTVAQVNAALAATTYTAPSTAAPSATYPAG